MIDLPLQIASALPPQSHRLLLHSATQHNQQKSFSFVSCHPVQTLTLINNQLILNDDTGRRIAHPFIDPFDLIEDWIDKESQTDLFHRYNDDAPFPMVAGFISYDFGYPLQSIKRSHTHQSSRPLLWFGFYSALWRYDHQTTQQTIIGTRQHCLERLKKTIQQPKAITPHPLSPFQSNWTQKQYTEQFTRVQQYITEGDVYQVNLSHRLTSTMTTTTGDPLGIYTAISKESPAAFGAFVESDHLTLISNSPECFLERTSFNDPLKTHPIKGTCSKNISKEQLKAFVTNEKECAEHLMIVDVVRNDLGRIATIGSVNVDSLLQQIELPTLYHLVSTISCMSQEKLSDIIYATFPGGSITGAPKIRSMQIIDELESVERSIYTGAIGYFGAQGAINLSVAIRTAYLCDDKLHLHVGGGIVSDSTASGEWEETQDKALAWRQAIASCT